ATHDLQPQQPDLGEARASLDRALTDARAFAAKAHVPGWGDAFTDAIETDDDRPPYMPDLMDPAFPAAARHLIAKAARSWVFGGMGSWNDLGFSDESRRAEHAEVSRRLFAAVLNACVAAVNCPLPD